MNTLQKVLNTTLDDICEPQELIRPVCSQLREWGIQLSDSERGQLEDEFQKITLEAATLDLRNYEFLDSTDSRLITDANRMPIAKRTLKFALGLVMAKKTKKLVEGLQEHSSSILRDEREEQTQLEQRVKEEWQEPLDRLSVLIALTKEVRSFFDDRFLDDAALPGEIVFAVLAILHARACQVSSEILVLLRFGLADGAFARWRTLYELSAVCLFIAKHGQEVAERYLIHEPLERSKLARRYQQDRGPDESSQVPQDWIDNLASIQDSLIELYDERFEGDYGWAAGVLTGIPNLFRIAQCVGIDDSYFFYKLASSSVHASAFSTFQCSEPEAPLGRPVHTSPGPTVLKVPGYLCARSLEVIATTLLKSQPGLDDSAILKRGIILRSLRKLVSDVLKAFEEAEGKVES